MSSFFWVVAKQVKSHPALIPLFIFISGGATMSVLALTRAALKNPDVSWDHKNNPEPWNQMQPNQQYKVRAVFLNPLGQVIEQACFYKGQAIIFCYLASKSISQQSYDNAYLFLCVSSFLQ
uniref:Cytochrome c oxidase subunit NDUFA4 n=1 Tax=Haplochromis burtoni TaxID=8153 RepID=A0A3Q2V2R6_HAPBU